MHHGQDAGDFTLVAHGVNAAEERPDGIKIVGLGYGLVHATGIKVADFLLVGGARRSGGLIFLEDLAQDLAIPFGKFAGNSPHHLVGWNWILLFEPGAGVLVEVVAGVHGRIDAGDINVLQLDWRGSGLGERQERREGRQQDCDLKLHFVLQE